MSLYLEILLIGLFGSMHCIGMCGGFVAMYSLRSPGERTPLFLHAMYNLGRITTYSFLGGLVGYLGSFSAYLTPSRSVPGFVLMLAGVIMLLMGLNILGLLGKRGLFETDFVTGLPLFKRTLRAALDMRSQMGFYLFGVLLGFLPCGLLYPILIQAAISGGILKGMVLMAIFGIGTVPALTVFGLILSRMKPRVRSYLYRIAGLLIILLGVQTIMRGIAFQGWILPGRLW